VAAPIDVLLKYTLVKMTGSPVADSYTNPLIVPPWPNESGEKKTNKRKGSKEERRSVLKFISTDYL
jgi:hypothetical protein